MTLERAELYTPDGRLRGSYVYMILWQFEDPVHIKLGRSCTPFSGLKQWDEAKVIAVAEVPSLRAAVRMESQLRAAFAPWHRDIDWFTVLPAQRAEFNAAWRPVMDANSSASRRIYWRNYSIPALLSAAEERRRQRQKTFMRRPLEYQDFRR